MLPRKNPNFKKLPESELEIMKIIWDLDKKGEDEIHTGVIYRDYSHIVGRLKLTTVLTLITRLASRGFIDVRKVGRFNCYRPIVKEEDYNKLAAEDFCATVFNNDTKGLISALLGDGKITAEDIDDLRKQIIGKTEE